MTEKQIAEMMDGLRKDTREALQSDIDELAADPRFADIVDQRYDNTPPRYLPKLREGEQYLPLWGSKCEK